MLNIGVKRTIYTCCPDFLHPVLNRVEASEIGYRLAKGVFWSMAGTVISRGLVLASMVLVARMLGKTIYGELGMIRSTVAMFGVFAGFGLGLTATKHVAEFRQSDPDRAGRIIDAIKIGVSRDIFDDDNSFLSVKYNSFLTLGKAGL